jgi:hypothetical protein
MRRIKSPRGWRDQEANRCCAWDFNLNVNADEIVVTVPSTNYTVTYYKPDNSPQLLARKFPNKDDSSAPMTQAEFSFKRGG